MPQWVTLISDFGDRDAYAAEVKGAIVREAADVRFVDVTHAIAANDVQAAAIVLERTIAAFPAGTIHLAMVDGDNPHARPALFRLRGQCVLAQDNGVITWAHHRLGPAAVEWIDDRGLGDAPFAARDVLSPAAGRLANGETIGRPDATREPAWLDLYPATGSADARVIGVDHFGNVLTNVTAEFLAATPSCQTVRVESNGRTTNVSIGPTFRDLAANGLRAYVGSGGLLELAVRNGRAADVLRLRINQAIELV